jgi:hypothetical protein
MLRHRFLTISVHYKHGNYVHSHAVDLTDSIIADETLSGSE